MVSRLREYYRDAAGSAEVNVMDLKHVVQVRRKPSLRVLVIGDDETAPRNLIFVEYLTLDGHNAWTSQHRPGGRPPARSARAAMT